MLLIAFQGLLPLLLTVLAVGFGVIASVSIGYLLLLLAAARMPRRASGGELSSGSPLFVPSVTVVIPSHNEELVLAATLNSLQQQDYSAESVSVVVIADNCCDTTAAIAKKWGAIVLERTDTTRRGKGYALEWAFSSLLGAESPVKSASVFVIVDADTVLAPNFLSVMVARLSGEIKAENLATAMVALQGRYGVLNAQEGWRTALMTAAFDLVNHVRLLGAANLGWTVGLKGNGMLFTRALLEKAQWQGRSITEDIDYGLDLLLDHTIKVGYEPLARVWAQMPEGDAPAASQRERWERGRYRLVRQRVPTLLWQGLTRRNPALFAAGVDLAVPPLAELAGYLLLWGVCVGIGIGAYSFSLIWVYCWLAAVLGFLVYVMGGLKTAGAGRETFVGLLYAPLYIFWKFALYAARFIASPFRRKANGANSTQNVDSWIRTERRALEPISAAGSGEMPEKESKTTR